MPMPAPIRWLVVALCLSLSLSACKGKEKKAAAAAVDTAAEEQLIARRDALMKSRATLAEEKVRLAAEREKIAQEGGDTAEVDKKAEELRTQEQALSTQESDIVEQLMDERKTLLAAAQGGADATAQVAVREAGIGGREKLLATREDRVAQREAALATREREQALREKEMCSGGGTTTIIQAVDPKAGKHTRGEVEGVFGKAKSLMSDKGILVDDLPAALRELYKDTGQALKDNEIGTAFITATQFYKQVAAMQVDREFVQAKSHRLSAVAKRKSLSDSETKQVSDLLASATELFVDGNYKGANKKLNSIWPLLNH